ncbi:MAG: hypothetical protein KJ672_02935 [Candidatus Thermoplasmatota archaeon]|nr:hypothetical protein [Candidatus Thermoplasmatota archaeon]
MMAGEGISRTPLSQRSPEQIIEAELSWISSMVLFFSTVYAVLKLDVLWIAFGIAAISLYILPIMSMRDPFRALPWEMTILLSAPMLLHISEGSRALMQHVAWWNDFTSVAFAFSLATIGFLLTVELQMYTSVKMNRPFAVFFVIMFTVAVAGFWQVGEFVGDQISGTNHLGTNADVMKILVWSSVGGMIMGFVYDLYIRAMSESRRKTLGFIHLWEVTDWRRS